MNGFCNDRASYDTVTIGGRHIGAGQPCYEIGIDRNGDLDLAKKLISVAVSAGCDAFNFRKRTSVSAAPMFEQRLATFNNRSALEGFKELLVQ